MYLLFNVHYDYHRWDVFIAASAASDKLVERAKKSVYHEDTAEILEGQYIPSTKWYRNKVIPIVFNDDLSEEFGDKEQEHYLILKVELL